jgi:uncharacterized protein
MSRMTISAGTGLADALSPVDAWLGTGLRFPVAPDGQSRRIESVQGMDLVRQSIETILDTEPGERIMLPTFGCSLRRFLMAPNTAATHTAMRTEITDALTTWEPRIRLSNVAVTAGDVPTLVWVDISYVRLMDLRPDSLVYPFYLQ